jgi:hypothetical protein
MDAIEFVTNYNRYIQEIRSVISSNLLPVSEKLKDKNPHDLITPETWFPNENADRGLVWGLFIEAVNKYAHQHITIDIKEINNVEDMEMFFALLYKEKIFYHPESSFHDFVHTDIYGNETGQTFTDEECEHLDRLNDKCWKVAKKENVDIFEVSMRVQKLIWGDPEKLKL